MLTKNYLYTWQDTSGYVEIGFNDPNNPDWEDMEDQAKRLCPSDIRKALESLLGDYQHESTSKDIDLLLGLAAMSAS